MAKFVTKMLKIDNLESQNKTQMMISKYPSCVHLAQVMEEQTDQERETFGKVKLKGIKPSIKDWIEDMDSSDKNEKSISSLQYSIQPDGSLTDK